MKVFRTLVGLAAIGGAYAYTRKHGGVRNTFDQLMRKKDDLLQKLDDKRSEIASKQEFRTQSTDFQQPVEHVTPADTETLFPDIPPLGQR
jgi:hypothetical protein